MRKRSSWFAVFERMAVQTDLVFVCTAQAIHSKKNLSSVRMALAICSKKNVICLNGLHYPLERLGLSV